MLISYILLALVFTDSLKENCIVEEVPSFEATQAEIDSYYFSILCADYKDYELYVATDIQDEYVEVFSYLSELDEDFQASKYIVAIKYFNTDYYNMIFKARLFREEDVLVWDRENILKYRAETGEEPGPMSYRAFGLPIYSVYVQDNNIVKCEIDFTGNYCQE